MRRSKSSKNLSFSGHLAFVRLRKSVWSGRDISVTLKLRLYDALILPIAINGSETWFFSQLDSKNLGIFENNCLRAILNIRLQDHVSIDEIRKVFQQINRTVLKT